MQNLEGQLKQVSERYKNNVEHLKDIIKNSPFETYQLKKCLRLFNEKHDILDKLREF